MRPVAEFDPTKPARVHDEVNDSWFDWDAERHLENFRQNALPQPDDIIACDGLLLDGWEPLPLALTSNRIDREVLARLQRKAHGQRSLDAISLSVSVVLRPRP